MGCLDRRDRPQGLLGRIEQVTRGGQVFGEILFQVLVTGPGLEAQHFGLLGKNLQGVESERWDDLGQVLVDLIGRGRRLGGSAVGGSVVDLLHLKVELRDIQSDCQLDCAARVERFHSGDKCYRGAEGQLDTDV